MGFGWQEIDKILDLGYIRVAGLHCECKPMVLCDPLNMCPRTMTHTLRLQMLAGTNFSEISEEPQIR